MAVEEQKRLAILNTIEAHADNIANALISYRETVEMPGFNVALVQNFTHFLDRLKIQKRIQERLLEKQDKNVNQARETLKFFLMKQKSLELLRDKAEREFKTQLEHLEQQVLEEISQNRYYRDAVEKKRRDQRKKKALISA